MLSIWFGEKGLDLEGRIVHTSDYFDGMYEQSWFQSDLAKEIIKGVDKSNYISGEYIESPVFGGISPRDLSTGCKTLLVLLNEDNVVVSGERMGDNCYPWLLRIAEQKDITITLCHNVEIPEPFEIRNLNTGKILTKTVEILLSLHDLEWPPPGWPED